MGRFTVAAPQSEPGRFTVPRFYAGEPWEDASPAVQRRRKADGSFEYRPNAGRFAGAEPGVGKPPEQSVGGRALAFGDRAVSAAAEGLVAIPELAAKFLPDDSPSAMLPSQDTEREVPGDPYPTLGKPGGFFDLKASREDIRRQNDAHREAMAASKGDPYVIAAADTLAEAAGMALPIPGLHAPAGAARGLEAGAARSAVDIAAEEEAAYLARRAKAMRSMPGGDASFVGPGAVADALQPEGTLLQVGEHADRAAQDAALGLRGAPGSADELARASLAIDEHAAPAPLPRREPPSLAEIFGEPRRAENSPENLTTPGKVDEPPASSFSSPLEGVRDSQIQSLAAGDRNPAPPAAYTGTKNAVADAERVARGLPEVERLARKHSGETWAEAKRIFTEDPEHPRLLAAQIVKKPRALTPLENDILLHDRMKLTLDHREALADEMAALDAGNEEAAAMAKMRRQSIEAANDLNDTAAVYGGSEASASLNARKKLIAEDFSPLYLRQRLNVAAREAQVPVLPGAEEKLTQISRQLEEAHAQLAGYEERVSHLEAERAMGAVQKDVAKAERSGIRRAAKVDLDAEYQELAARLDKKAAINQSTANMSGGLDPETVGIISKMAQNRVQAGARGLGEVVDGIYQTIRPHIEGLEPREVRDAISGYGVVRQQATRSEAAAELAQIRQQGRLVSKLEALQGGETFPASVPRSPLAPKVAALQEKLRQTMADLGIARTRTEAQRLETIKTGLERRIAAAERGIAPRRPAPAAAPTAEIQALRARLQKVLEEGHLLPDPSVARVKAAESVAERALADLESRLAAGDLSSQASTASPWSAKLGELRSRHVELRTRLEEMRKAARPVRDPEMVKLQAAERSAAKSVEALEKKVAAKDLSSSGPTSSRWSPELGKLRQEQARLRQQLEDLRKDARPARDPEAARLAGLKKRLAVREIELTQHLAQGYFPKVARRPLALDADAIAIQGRVNALKKQASLIIRKQELAGRSGLEKGLDWTAGWGRGLKLSGTGTLFKIAAAAGQRALVFKPVEELIGAALSKVPVLRTVAAKAPIEGGGSLGAIAKSYAGFFGKQARAESMGYLRGGEGPLESALGKQHLGGEAPAWMEFPGKVHAALKAPAKVAGYEFAMEKQAQWYLKQGKPEALLDPVLQEEMKARAWEYATRDIFMGDNAFVKRFNDGLRKAEADSLPTKAGLTVGRVLLPIVKVPTNYALEVTDYALGIPKASLRLGWAVHKGLETLPSKEAEQIMRQFKKGTLGAGLIALGATGAVEAGGYYEPGKHRGHDELHPGEVRIAGIKVPHMLLHHPAVEALQIGVSLHRAHSFGEGFENAAWGVGEQVPFFEEPITAARTLRQDPSQFFGGIERGMTIPPDAQRLARVLDQKHEQTPAAMFGQQLGLGGLEMGPLSIPELEARKRRARGSFWEQLVEEDMLGIPGLRDNVR